MNFQTLVQNFKGHLSTVNRHKLMVLRHCFRVGLYWQGITHDLSKYSLTEFIPGVIYFQGNRSPNNAERETKGLSKAWLHHKGRNKHHYEYWIDYPPVIGEKTLEGMRMPDRYIIEMFCDRVAASKIYNGDNYTDRDPLDYFEKGKGHYVMHPHTYKLLYGLLKMLAAKGEDYTFRYIRKRILR